MKRWDEVVKDALEMHLHKDRFCYFYGAKGVGPLTDAQMEALWAAEPGYFSKYSAAQKRAIFDFSRGKIAYDCSGFTAKLTGDMSYSVAQIGHCTNKKSDMALGEAGSLIFTTFGGKGRHIGVDIGYGYYLHFTREGESCELGRFIEGTTPWEVSGLCPLVDYTGATNR